MKKDDVVRGQVVSAPGAIVPHAKGSAEIVLLTEKEGGRHTPFSGGYAPQFFFGGADVTGTILTDTPVEPGAHARVKFALVHPVAMEPGMCFALREWSRTIGAGFVLDVETVP